MGNGYYVLIEPLSKGQHSKPFGGSLHFTLAAGGLDGDFSIDTTYHLALK